MRAHILPAGYRRRAIRRHGGLGELTLPARSAVPAIHSEGQLLITLSKASIHCRMGSPIAATGSIIASASDFGAPAGAIETREIAAPEPPAPAG